MKNSKMKKNTKTTALDQLFDAIDQGNIRKVKSILKTEGLNLNDGEDMLTPLMFASGKVNLNIVKLLVESGADTSTKSVHGDFALKIAAESGNKDIFDYLFPLTKDELRKEAQTEMDEFLQKQPVVDLRVSNCLGAISRGNLTELKDLIDEGININSVNKLGESMLHRSVSSENIEAVNFLLALGINPNLRGEGGFTPLMTRFYTDDGFKILDLLIRSGADVNAFNNSSISVLLYAVVVNSKPEAVQSMINAGADLNYKGPHGITPLILTHERGSISFENILTKAGASIEGVEIGDYLHSAWWGFTEKIQSILKTDIDINVQGFSGNTALYNAASGQQVETVNLLLRAGVNPDIQNEDGNTAIFRATELGTEKSIEVIKLLLNAGSNPTIKNNFGSSALSFAQGAGKLYGLKKEYPEILRLLTEAAL
jgi:uncharacterized protein